MALALPRTKMIPSLPYKMDRIIDFDLFVMMAVREAIKEKVSQDSVPHAPYISTTKGVQRHPISSSWSRTNLEVAYFKNYVVV